MNTTSPPPFRLVDPDKKSRKPPLDPQAVGWIVFAAASIVALVMLKTRPELEARAGQSEAAAAELQTKDAEMERQVADTNTRAADSEREAAEVGRQANALTDSVRAREARAAEAATKLAQNVPVARGLRIEVGRAEGVLGEARTRGAAASSARARLEQEAKETEGRVAGAGEAIGRLDRSLGTPARAGIEWLEGEMAAAVERGDKHRVQVVCSAARSFRSQGGFRRSASDESRLAVLMTRCP